MVKSALSRVIFKSLQHKLQPITRQPNIHSPYLLFINYDHQSEGRK